MSASTPPPPLKDNIPIVTITSPTSPTIKTPRTARFAEATAVNSPIEPNQASNPFRDPPTNHYKPQPQVSDVGFGYLHSNPAHESVEIEETDEKYLPLMTPKTPKMRLKSPLKSPLRSPLKSPLKTALKSPGAPPRHFDANAILSPTFMEENALEKAEKITTREQRRDLRAKMRVRIAKMLTRGVNFSCSLIVLSMLAVTFSIFNATKDIPARNNLPAWAINTSTWPQVTLLCIACASLAMSIFVFYGYYRGGHRRAEKVGIYYTTFSVVFFVFSIIMWMVGAIILNESRNNGNGNDIWGWSCKNNRRASLFQQDVQYSLICRFQNWSLLCCIIEVVIELITIVIYGITFYRYYTKRRLRKTMATRDRARTDLYLAQLRAQSAPNTPGFPLSPGFPQSPGILSPRDGGWVPPQGFDHYNTNKRGDKEAEAGFSIEEVEEEGVQYATVPTRKLTAPAPFTLQAPPLAKKKPSNTSDGTMPISPRSIAPVTSVAQGETLSAEERRNSHVPAAPGETQYGSVAIPGAYTPMSPSFPENVAQVHGFNFNTQ